MISFPAAVRKNPLASKTSLKTLEVATAKWLYGARDRAGGHKQRMLHIRQRTQGGQSRQEASDVESDN